MVTNTSIEVVQNDNKHVVNVVKDVRKVNYVL